MKDLVTAMNRPLSLLESAELKSTHTVDRNPDALRNNKIVMGLYRDPRADVFRVLRASILQQLRENSWNTVAITSATPGAGKTFIAANLAVAIALAGNQNVVLIDADLYKPMVAAAFGFEAKLGFVDYLETARIKGSSSNIFLDDVLAYPGFERLSIIPGRHSESASSELICSSRMGMLLDDVAAKFASRVVIIDIPPLFLADDALMLLPYVDGVVLVAEDEKNTAPELQQALHMLEQVNLLGVVLNKAKGALPAHQISYAQYKSLTPLP